MPIINREKQELTTLLSRTLKLAALSSFLCSVYFIPQSHSQTASLELTPLAQSRAFQQFQNRDDSERSKLLFLVDRLSESNIKEIMYEGRAYHPMLVTGIARLYLSRHYEQEPAEGWLSKWCFRTIRKGEPVWVKLANGECVNAKEVLLGELEKLETIDAV